MSLNAQDLSPESRIVALGRPHPAGSPINQPIVPASNYRHEPSSETEDLSYARGDGTPSWWAFEEVMGEIEGGTAVSFSSGIGAVAAVLADLPTGAKVVAPVDLYHGVGVILEEGSKRLGWQVERIESEATEKWYQAIDGADLVWLESPSNPLLQISDLPAICAKASRAGVSVAVDSTFATPLRQNPLAFGATYAVHSATKFIGGHSDLMSGVVVASTPELADQIRHRRMISGATPGSLETFLALRGLRTLSVRLDKAEANAIELAARLDEHRLVTKVHYPGLQSHPGFDLAQKTMSGPGAMMSFEVTGSATSLDVRIGRLSLIVPATSLGGVETSLERRSKSSAQSHLAPTLVRMSVGIENVDDLWDDLDQALNGIINS